MSVFLCEPVLQEDPPKKSSFQEISLFDLVFLEL